MALAELVAILAKGLRKGIADLDLAVVSEAKVGEEAAITYIIGRNAQHIVPDIAQA